MEDNFFFFTEITKLEEKLHLELLQQNDNNAKEKINLVNKCSILEEYQGKAETELDNRQKEINVLQEEIKTLRNKTTQDISERDRIIVQIKEERDALISKLNEQMKQLQNTLNYLKNEVVIKEADIGMLSKKLEERNQQDEVIKTLKKENEQLCKAMGQTETCKLSESKNQVKRNVICSIL